jgi:hypothetical protein
VLALAGLPIPFCSTNGDASCTKLSGCGLPALAAGSAADAATTAAEDGVWSLMSTLLLVAENSLFGDSGCPSDSAGGMYLQ